MSPAETAKLLVSNIDIAVICLLVINLIGFALMGIDKHKAKMKKWRIPEKTFFIVTALFGGIGSMLGMYTFRHKTKHWYFAVGIPLITVVEYAAAVGLILYFK